MRQFEINMKTKAVIVNKTGTPDVLDIQELQLKFQMNQIESVKTYFVQTTIINYLTNFKNSSSKSNVALVVFPPIKIFFLS